MKITQLQLGVSLGTDFTETGRINPKKNDYGVTYWSTEYRNIWFGYGITPIKNKIPIYHIENTKKYNTPKILNNNTKTLIQVSKIHNTKIIE